MYAMYILQESVWFFYRFKNFFLLNVILNATTLPKELNLANLRLSSVKIMISNPGVSAAPPLRYSCCRQTCEPFTVVVSFLLQVQHRGFINYSTSALAA